MFTFSKLMHHTISAAKDSDANQAALRRRLISIPAFANDSVQILPLLGLHMLMWFVMSQYNSIKLVILYNPAPKPTAMIMAKQ